MEVFLMLTIIMGIIDEGTSVQCSQCDSDIDPDCRDSPPPPSNCTLCSHFDFYTGKCTAYQEVEFCIIERRFINDTMIRITRDCSPQALSNVCEDTDMTYDGTPIVVCFYTCRYTGCNSCGRLHSTKSAGVFAAFMLLCYCFISS